MSAVLAVDVVIDVDVDVFDALALVLVLVLALLVLYVAAIPPPVSGVSAAADVRREFGEARSRSVARVGYPPLVPPPWA